MLGRGEGKAGMLGRLGRGEWKSRHPGKEEGKSGHAGKGEWKSRHAGKGEGKI